MDTSEILHFERCPVCGELFDRRDLNAVRKHMHAGLEDVEPVEGKKVEREEDLN